MSSYGKRGGVGPTRGKKTIMYEVTLPDGTTLRKRVYGDRGETTVATAFKHAGKPVIALWTGEPGWEGDFGRLVARRI